MPEALGSIPSTTKKEEKKSKRPIVIIISYYTFPSYHPSTFWKCYFLSLYMMEDFAHIVL
jgi:hypothetical protein